MLFPESSRVWITDRDGNCFTEYEGKVETGRPLKHIRSAYIAAEKGEFIVWYNMGPSVEPCRRLEVRVDGQLVQSWRIRKDAYGQSLKCDGWLLDSTTVKRFVFGDIDLRTEGDEALGTPSRPTTSCIEVSFIDAVIRLEARKEVPLPQNEPQIASPSRPDSKASLVGVQVKPGSTRLLTDPLNYSKHRSVAKGDSIKYMARFKYRPKALLEAHGIVPSSSVTTSASHTSSDLVASNETAGNTDLADATNATEAAAGQAQKRKHKHVAFSAPVIETQVVKTEPETENERQEQRRKRLMTDLRAIQREYGHEEIFHALLDTSKQAAQVEDGHSVTVNDEPLPGQSTLSAIKPGQSTAAILECHGTSSKIKGEATLKHQSIFVDLSVDSDYV